MPLPKPQPNRCPPRPSAGVWQNRLAILLAGGFLLQMALAALTEGYEYDVSCFLAWAIRMDQTGAAAFYAEGYFCDYPPAYLLLLRLVGRAFRVLQLSYTARAARLLLCFFPACAACALAGVVWRIGQKYLAPHTAFRLAAFAMFCPALLYDTAIWKQIDAVFALPIVLCFWLLSEKKYLPAALCYGFALAVKPQALLAGPVLAAAFLAPLLAEKTAKAGRKSNKINDKTEKTGTTALSGAAANGIEPAAAEKLPLAGILKNLVLGAGLALLPPLACGLPFFGVRQLLPRLFEIYTGTAASYPYAAINACNWMAALGANWKPQTEVFLLLSWQQWGILAIGLLTAALLFLAVKSSRAGRFCPLLLAAFYTVGVFTFSHRMHERYLIFGILLTLAAAARWGDKRLFGAAAGLSLTALVNLAEVMAGVGTNDEWLSGTVPAQVLRICGAAETICFLLLAAAVGELLLQNRRCPLPGAMCPMGEDRNGESAAAGQNMAEHDGAKGENENEKAPRPEQSAAERNLLERAVIGQSAAEQASAEYPGSQEGKAESAAASLATAASSAPAASSAAAANPAAASNPAPAALPPLPQPKWLRGEKIFLALLTLATAAVSLFALGDFTAPQNPLDTAGGSVSTTVQVQGTAAELWVYPGISENGALWLFDASGNQVAEITLNYSNPFSWQRAALPAASAAEQYTVVVANARVMELAFCNAEGEPLPVLQAGDAAPSPLFDEQELVPKSISCKNSTYFDEIYHARTGYEMGRQMTVYETTHPPLGKDFILLGIALFGMTGFGWRVMGAIFGVLMVPVFVLLVRRVTRSRRLAALGGVLLALDGLRFVQSRIATIDVYATFFILLSAYLMIVFAQTTLQKGVHHALLPLGLCGLSFGLGCASKWTGIYAGAGLAVLFFGVLWARWRQKPKTFVHEFWLAIFAGVLFFVAVPLAVYLASYLPYWWRDPSFGLADWVNCQKYMYWYHSSLEASHPFESRWYTWPLLLRPVWYYAGSGLAAGSAASIAAIGSPVVFWGGAFGILALGWRQLSGQGSRAGGAVCVLYLTQMLPWVLVSRCTFLYHYFPGMLFALLAMLCTLQALCAPGGSWAGRGRRIGVLLVVLAAVWFLLFYPVLSGLSVPSGYLDWLKWLPGWGW